ncbi:MAG: TSUP family transporter [Chloroflexi bacterium]|nr:TSUP family transporter [Chloroflexota bacterium]
MLLILTLCVAAFLAGLVDSMVGGGGLIQLPVMLILLPSTPIATLLGTNKFVAITGTSMAAFQYARRIQIRWRTVLPMAAAAFVFSMIGARVVTGMQPEQLRPAIIVLLTAIAIYIFANKQFGADTAAKATPPWQRWAGLAAGAAIGFYDGFFGPGTGSFLIFILVSLFGMNFISASGSAKVVNVATNAAALIYFAATGHILFSLALPMAACNILGAVTGSRLAIDRGNRLLRTLFLVVVSAMIVKLCYDTFQAQPNLLTWLHL